MIRTLSILYPYLIFVESELTNYDGECSAHLLVGYEIALYLCNRFRPKLIHKHFFLIPNTSVVIFLFIHVIRIECRLAQFFLRQQPPNGFLESRAQNFFY